MPITYQIDRGQRTVFARAMGILRPEDLFAYQKQVWMLPEVRDFNECVDMSGVTEIVDATGSNMQALAALAVQADDPMRPTRLAVIANEKLHYGLARMYEIYRSMEPDNSREVGIFRTRDEAMSWLFDKGTAT